ncbi:hypothetical protein D3C76_1360560 [compost metagenome]
MLNWLLAEAQKVADILKSPPDNVRNIAEFAKRDFCWEQYVKGKVGLPSDAILQFGITQESYADENRQGNRESVRNLEVDFDIALFALVPRANEIIIKARQSGAASPKNISALTKVASGRLNLSKGEKTALKYLLERLEIEC